MKITSISNNQPAKVSFGAPKVPYSDTEILELQGKILEKQINLVDDIFEILNKPVIEKPVIENPIKKEEPSFLDKIILGFIYK